MNIVTDRIPGILPKKLPPWAIWALAAGIGLFQLALLAGIIYLIYRNDPPEIHGLSSTEAVAAPPVAAASPLPPLADEITASWVEDEANRLRQQAEADVKEPTSPCFNQSPACALGHYAIDTEVRQRALQLINVPADEAE